MLDWSMEKRNEEGGAMILLMESFFCSSRACVYIGHLRRHRNDKDQYTLYRS